MPYVLSSTRALAVALALVPMVQAPACAAPSLEATVVSVGDGDTIRVRDFRRQRRGVVSGGGAMP